MEAFQQEYKKIKEACSQNPYDGAFKAMQAGLGPVILWGAGGEAKVSYKFCKDNGIKVACFCDNSKTGHLDFPGGECIPVISPEILLEKHRTAYVFISTIRCEYEVLQFLHDNGFEDSHIVPYSYMQRIGIDVFESEYVDGFERAYNLFGDVESKKVVLDKIRYFFTSNVLTPTTKEPIFFNALTLDPKREDVMVDVGANTGDTIIAYLEALKKVGGTYRAIYGFEPGEEQYKDAVATLAACDDVWLIKKGLWSETTELKFFDDGGKGASLLHNRAVKEVVVPVVKIDEFFQGQNASPTLIKMNIEGSEYGALCGGKNTIVQDKPCLAISIDHEPDDFYKLPELIKSFRDDYECKIKQHKYSLGYTCLYAW